jgi:hypothetical protein
MIEDFFYMLLTSVLSISSLAVIMFLIAWWFRKTEEKVDQQIKDSNDKTG